MRRLGATLAAAALLLSSFPTTADEPHLTGIAVLARLYRQILNVDDDLTDSVFEANCAPAPREACETLRVAAHWWRIQLDPVSTAGDAAFERRVADAIAAAEAWTVREPRSAEAWFYLGAAYAARVQWLVLRDQKLAAARNGKRIKDALERAITLDPRLEDAYFGLGLYQYYAAIAPTTAKIVRWLLFLPGGDRVKGLDQMLRVRARGELLVGEADYQLALIYLWYEQNHIRALELLQGLHAAYPGNPVFLRMIAEVQDMYSHDAAASLDSYRALLRAAQDGSVNAAPIALVDARLGVARHLDAMYQTDRAIDELEAVVAVRPGAPHGALARAHYQLGAAHDRLGDRARAMEAYRNAALVAPARDRFKTAEQARAALKRQPNARAADAYRLSLEGWRAFERQNLDVAERLLTRALELQPSDPVTQYRHARLLTARQQHAAALAHYERAIALRAGAPPSIVASTYFFTARLLERMGERARAITMYERAAHAHGAAQETRASATRALVRLRARAGGASRR